MDAARLLVVDDDPINRRLPASYRQRERHAFVTAMPVVVLDAETASVIVQISLAAGHNARPAVIQG